MRSRTNPARNVPVAKAQGLRWAKQPQAGICASSYVADPEDSVFVITSYDLAGKPLAAFRQAQKEEATMNQSKFPSGWDDEKVRRVLAHYEEQTEVDALEDEAGIEPSETVMDIPHDLVPKVREWIAKHQHQGTPAYP